MSIFIIELSTRFNSAAETWEYDNTVYAQKDESKEAAQAHFIEKHPQLERDIVSVDELVWNDDGSALVTTFHQYG